MFVVLVIINIAVATFFYILNLKILVRLSHFILSLIL
jgi:hypothetical protein